MEERIVENNATLLHKTGNKKTVDDVVDHITFSIQDKHVMVHVHAKDGKIPIKHSDAIRLRDWLSIKYGDCYLPKREDEDSKWYVEYK